MKKIKVKDKEFEVFISSEKIVAAINTIAEQLNRDLKGQRPVFLGVLNGSFMFAGDLFKKLDMDCEISFVKLASYSGTRTSSNVAELIGLSETLMGRQVIILEDIIDTGITIDYLIRKINELGVSDLRIVTLFFKPDAFKKDFRIDYIGMEIPNDFVVGYGLDYDGYGRNYAEIYKIVN